MNPAWSVVFFTSLAGVAQGLLVGLAAGRLAGLEATASFRAAVLLIGAALLVASLVASFFHLGRPERAWRAALMWRTSWLSREVIALPAFIGLVAAWWLAERLAPTGFWARIGWPLLALAGSAVLWTCTAMIYACLRFIEEWAHPATLVTFVLTGLASGSVLGAALASLAGEAAFASLLGRAGLVLTLAAGVARWLALRRNAGIRHRSTLQSATGIAAGRLVQTSMGMSAGSFNTREFFHHATRATLRHMRLALLVLGYAVPAALAVLGLATGAAWPWLLAVGSQSLGVVADRWTFFAQAKHPQNLYYQVVG